MNEFETVIMLFKALLGLKMFLEIMRYKNRT